MSVCDHRVERGHGVLVDRDDVRLLFAHEVPDERVGRLACVAARAECVPVVVGQLRSVRKAVELQGAPCARTDAREHSPREYCLGGREPDVAGHRGPRCRPDVERELARLWQRRDQVVFVR